MKRFPLAAILCLLLCPLRAVADAGGQSAEFVATSWHIQDGLPSDRVQAVTQTHDGYLWVATFNGLARFDGVRFETFSDANTPTLRNNLVNSIFEDAENRLWIGSDTGEICWRDGEGFHALKTPDAWPNAPIDRFAQAKDGTLYVANREGHLLCVSNCQSAGILGQAPSNLYADVASDSAGEVWAIRFGGALVRLHGIEIDSSQTPPIEHGYRDVIGANHGGIWVRNGDTLRRWDKGNWVEDRGTHSWRTEHNVAMFETTSGDVWVGTVNDGVFIVAPDGRERHLGRGEGLGHESVLSIVADHEGNVWLGTDGGGLEMLRKRVVDMVSPPDRWQNRAVLSVSPATNGGLWVGTEGAGLYYWNKENFLRVPGPSTPGASDIRSVMQDRSGKLWVGTQGAGVLSESSNGLASIRTRFGMPPLIYALFQDQNAGIWIGTQNGLMHLDGTNWIGLGGQLYRSEVRCIAQTPDGSIWIGMRGGGVARYRDGQFTQLLHEQGLGYNYIWCLYADPAGAVWIGTPGAGLIRWRDGNFFSFTQKDGLPSDFICDIQPDDEGHLWLGTYGGIVEVRKSQLDRYPESGAGSLKLTVLDRADGLDSLEFAGGNQPSVCQTPDGRLWFATSAGLAAVDPKRVEGNHQPPPVWIEEALVDGKPAPIQMKRLAPGQSQLVLQPGAGLVEFHYTALSFSAPRRCRFRYRLESIDTDWVEAGSRRTAYYSRLPPRQYHFQVVACNGDGVWNIEGAAIEFTVLPHFWENWWFGPLCWMAGVSLAGGIVLAIIRRRHQLKVEALERAQLVERERVRIARDLHDDLGSGLTEISMTGALARDPSLSMDEAREYLGEIVGRSTEMVGALDEIVWAVNPKNDDLNSLVTYFCQFAERFLRPVSISCRYQIPAQLPAIALNADQRHNLFMAFKEALQNVVKHSNASNLRLGLEIAQGAMRLTIEDDGRGFVEGDPQPGADGLRGMRERLQQLGGRCDVVSGLGEGTRIVLVLPLKTG
jgi:ligand-binding sensor domain-containing protein/signal transduction histidine kinase